MDFPKDQIPNNTEGLNTIGQETSINELARDLEWKSDTQSNYKPIWNSINLPKYQMPTNMPGSEGQGSLLNELARDLEWKEDKKSTNYPIWNNINLPKSQMPINMQGSNISSQGNAINKSSHLMRSLVLTKKLFI